MRIEKKQHTILLVDDTPDNLDLLNGVLAEKYQIKIATSGKIALKIAHRLPKPDLILLDIMMPEMDGYDVCRQLKSHPVTQDIPVIFITAKTQTEDETKGFALGAVDYITKPISPPIVRARVETHLFLHNQRQALELEVQIRTQELRQNQSEIINCLGRAAEFKDNETGMHVIRMSHYSRLLADAIHVDPKWRDLLFEAAPMHDVGKIGIADNILLKPDTLNDDEWHEMKRHVDYGVEILGSYSSPLLDLAKEIAQNHHEKWDGSGYPKGISGENIPLSARIVTIADVFDALTSVRPYKRAWTVEEAFQFITEQSGQHFDPQLVDTFLCLKDEINKIKQRFSD
ncbi:HD domain-containing phosphohydrolase [Vibrio nomapromontoriensis]|uniref:HD domain-containing phosphohydrolase n=1 Tax=Vibrio nomapromontoriensis TaxID=2910246 RepID=UPI003D0DAAFE